MMQGDGAFIISNAKSGRRIWAVDEATPPSTRERRRCFLFAASMSCKMGASKI